MATVDDLGHYLLCSISVANEWHVLAENSVFSHENYEVDA